MRGSSFRLVQVGFLSRLKNDYLLIVLKYAVRHSKEEESIFQKVT